MGGLLPAEHGRVAPKVSEKHTKTYKKSGLEFAIWVKTGRATEISVVGASCVPLNYAGFNSEL